jgi:hypothetical protein
MTSEKCVWARLPDVINPLELHPARFSISCIGETAAGAYPICPDVCPHCQRAVEVLA